MKKFLSLAAICGLTMIMPIEVFASNVAERIAERVTSNVLSNVITDSIREQHQEAKAKRQKAEEQAEAENKIITELSMKDYNDFLLVCASGDLGGFQKKFYSDKFSPRAYLKDNNEKTLLKLVASSSNPDILEFLFAQANKWR